MPSTSNLKRLFSVKEAANYTSLSRSSLYEDMKSGKLLFKKIGKRRVIEKDALDQFLDAKFDCEG